MLFSSFAQIQKDTLKVFFVGNSYTYYNDLPALVSSISEHTDTKIIAKSSLAGGAGLDDHWNSARGLNSWEEIKDGDFDIVVLQERSLGTIRNPESFHRHAKNLCALIRDSGAKPWFYVTWSRRNRPYDQKIITAEYQKAAEENDANLVLAGEAWAVARQQRPELELYHVDGSHPSPVGSFLSACVFVGSLVNEMPKNLPRNYSIFEAHSGTTMLSLDREEVDYCSSIARGITQK